MTTKIQSLIFKKKYWTLKNAKKWLIKHNYKTVLDEKEKTYRFRQIEPKKNYKYVMIKLKEGLSAVAIIY